MSAIGGDEEYAELVSGFQCVLCFQAVNSTKKPTYYVLQTTKVIESLPFRQSSQSRLFEDVANIKLTEK